MHGIGWIVCHLHTRSLDHDLVDVEKLGELPALQIPPTRTSFYPNHKSITRYGCKHLSHTASVSTPQVNPSPLLVLTNLKHDLRANK